MYKKYLGNFMVIFMETKKIAIFSQPSCGLQQNTITVKPSLELEFLENVNGININANQFN